MGCLQAAAEIVYVPGLQGAESATLMGAVGVRLRAALRSPSPPLVCSAARTAGQSPALSTYLDAGSIVAVHHVMHKHPCCSVVCCIVCQGKQHCTVSAVYVGLAPGAPVL